MFPGELMNRFPLLPLEEEGRPNDVPLRESFIEQVLPVLKTGQRLLSLDRNARRGANGRRPGPCPCGQGRQVSHSTQAHAQDVKHVSRHGTQPSEPGTPRRCRARSAGAKGKALASIGSPPFQPEGQQQP